MQPPNIVFTLQITGNHDRRKNNAVLHRANDAGLGVATEFELTAANVIQYHVKRFSTPRGLLQRLVSLYHLICFDPQM